MLRRGIRKSAKPAGAGPVANTTLPFVSPAASSQTSTPASLFHCSPSEEIIERVRLTIKNAHVFKLPPKPTSSGWRGADWRDKVWQGTLKVVERRVEGEGSSSGGSDGKDSSAAVEQTAVLLVDSQNEKNVFAVCPIPSASSNSANKASFDGAIDRCTDSSRYFILRVENSAGRHMFIGVAFNERNDAFDFNTALEDSRREKELERKVALGVSLLPSDQKDWSMKEGEKIKVNLNGDGAKGVAARRKGRKSRSSSGSSGFLAPSSKDTPSRLA